MSRIRLTTLTLCAALAATAAAADEAAVVGASAERTGSAWRFDVTVRHGDTGWDHYADAWRVVGPDGTVYGTRTLYHPHVDEQPFTRSLAGVRIPDGIRSVAIEAHDKVHGWGGKAVKVNLP